MVVDGNNSAWEANLPTKEGHLFPPLGTSSWLHMSPLLRAAGNVEKCLPQMRKHGILGCSLPGAFLGISETHSVAE